VPHNVVEPKTRSKKKLFMQLDRDVQVCGILLFGFLDTPCLRFFSCFWRGSCFIYIYKCVCVCVYADPVIATNYHIWTRPIATCRKITLYNKCIESRSYKCVTCTNCN
jgi:hypothetical protein